MIIDEFTYRFKELKKINFTNVTLQENFVKNFFLKFNPKVRVLATIFRPIILEEAIKAIKNIEVALKFFQSHFTLTSSDILSKKDYLNSLSTIHS